MRILPESRRGRVALAAGGAVAAVLVALAAYLLVIPWLRYRGYEPREGDIVFQSLPRLSALVRAIEGVTESPYSHCGVVVRKDGEWLVAESIGSVHTTPLFTYVLRGRGGKFAAYRLKPEHREHVPAFVTALEKYYGRPYDFRMRMDDEKLYCSELVYKAYRDATGDALGELVKLGEMNWEPYEEAIVRFEGGPPPLDREIMTPRDLARADQLELVYSAGY